MEPLLDGTAYQDTTFFAVEQNGKLLCKPTTQADAQQVLMQLNETDRLQANIVNVNSASEILLLG